MSDALGENSLNWAKDVFGGAPLGDSRRTSRLVLIASRAATRPGGEVSEVVLDPAERQGTYDFLESGHVAVRAVSASIAHATFRSATEYPFCFAAIDGSSLSLTDPKRTKGFGKIGTTGALAQSGHRYAVRGGWDRLVEQTGTSKHYLLREVLRRQKPIGSYEFDVPAGPKRRARRAKMTVRVAQGSQTWAAIPASPPVAPQGHHHPTRFGLPPPSSATPRSHRAK